VGTENSSIRQYKGPYSNDRMLENGVLMHLVIFGQVLYSTSNSLHKLSTINWLYCFPASLTALSIGKGWGTPFINKR
jgi:hypothetical protein